MAHPSPPAAVDSSLPADLKLIPLTAPTSSPAAVGLTSGTVHPVPLFHGDMLLSLVVPTGTVLINPVLSCLVHGDSSGAGGSSGYSHGGHSQPPASPVVEMEAVAEGSCEGP